MGIAVSAGGLEEGPKNEDDIEANHVCDCSRDSAHVVEELNHRVRNTGVRRYRQEDLGQKIKRTSAKRFGIELIERELKGAIGGTADFDYAAQGLAVKITIQAEHGAGA